MPEKSYLFYPSLLLFIKICNYTEILLIIISLKEYVSFYNLKGFFLCLKLFSIFFSFFSFLFLFFNLSHTVNNFYNRRNWFDRSRYRLLENTQSERGFESRIYEQAFISVRFIRACLSVQKPSTLSDERFEIWFLWWTLKLNYTSSNSLCLNLSIENIKLAHFSLFFCTTFFLKKRRLEKHHWVKLKLNLKNFENRIEILHL